MTQIAFEKTWTVLLLQHTLYRIMQQVDKYKLFYFSYMSVW